TYALRSKENSTKPNKPEKEISISVFTGQKERMIYTFRILKTYTLRSKENLTKPNKPEKEISISVFTGQKERTMNE
ncbi:20027_t:CDS:1, partial [Dentiscutata erythropus]